MVLVRIWYELSWIRTIASHSLGSHLFKYTFFELSPAGEELLVGCRRCLALVLEGRELRRADVIRRLEKAVVGSSGEPVGDGVLGERVVYGLVECARYRLLTVIVIDLEATQVEVVILT